MTAGRLFLVAALITASGAFAHAMPQSQVLLDVRSNEVDAELLLPLDRLQIAFGEPLEPATAIAQHGQELHAHLERHINPVSSDGRAWTVRTSSLEMETREGNPVLVAQVSLRPPRNAPANRFTLNYDAITHEIVTHVVLISVRGEGQGAPQLVGFLRGPVSSLQIDRPDPAPSIIPRVAVAALGLGALLASWFASRRRSSALEYPQFGG